MNWASIGNLFGSALTAALGGFMLSKQMGQTDEQAAIKAGYDFLVAVVQHLRGQPAITPDAIKS